MRTEILSALGASGAVLEELLAYNENPFVLGDKKLPLPSEPQVAAWTRYLEDPTWEGLRQRFPQLRYPIREGISATPGYQACTRQGAPAEEDSLQLSRPRDFSFRLHPTPAGSLPVLLPRGREDFVTLVQALSARNEPIQVPDSQGACLVRGFNNWDRIEQYLAECPPAPRAYQMAQLLPQKELYQDTFLIVSDGPYSQVSAAALGLDEEAWSQLSQAIRLSHESTHYFTLRLFGTCRNNLLDEVLADYVGVKQARGHFSARWMQLFMGVEDYPRYREGGRLQNYLGKPPVSEGATRLLQGMVYRAAERLETWNLDEVLVLTQLTLEELASPDADDYLARARQACAHLLTR